MAAVLNAAQQTAVRERMRAAGATGYAAERDEEHDEHVFVVLYADARMLGEVIVEGDGTIEGDD
jgi:hypothetical protein